MPRLVIGGHFPFVLVEQFFALGAHEDPVAGRVEVVHVDGILAFPRRVEGRFVDQVLQIGTGKPDGAGGDPLQIDVVCQRAPCGSAP